MQPGPNRLNGSKSPTMRALALKTLVSTNLFFGFLVFLDWLVPFLQDAWSLLADYFEETMIAWWTGWRTVASYVGYDVPAPENYSDYPPDDQSLYCLLCAGTVLFVLFMLTSLIAFAAVVIIPKIRRWCASSIGTQYAMSRSRFEILVAACRDFFSRLRCSHAQQMSTAATLGSYETVTRSELKSDVLQVLRDRLVLSRLGAITAAR